MHKNTGNLSVKYPRKNIKLRMYGEFSKSLFTVPSTGIIRPEVNLYSVQKQILKQSR